MVILMPMVRDGDIDINGNGSEVDGDGDGGDVAVSGTSW